MSQDDAKVVGHNDAGSGETYGVWGAVDSPDGYGLYTPDDAKIDGEVATDDAWEVSVDGDRGFLIDGNGTDEVNVVVGDSSNGVGDDVKGTFVGGGKYNTCDGNWTTIAGGINNTTSSTRATVVGGWQNESYQESFVGGGVSNQAMGIRSTIGGGSENEAVSTETTVAGGLSNRAATHHSTVGGGEGNEAGGSHATVPGGEGNLADGSHSFAAGREANAAHDGAFVVGDSSADEITSDGADEAHFQMPIHLEDRIAFTGEGHHIREETDELVFNVGGLNLVRIENTGSSGEGVYMVPGFDAIGDSRCRNDLTVEGTLTESSDRRIKEDVEHLEDVLEDVCSLEPARFRRTRDDDSAGERPQSVGFIAQEVREVFPDLVREDDADEDGEEGLLSLSYSNFTALAVQAIREQQAIIDEQAEEIDDLLAELADLRSGQDDLAARVDALESGQSAASAPADD